MQLKSQYVAIALLLGASHGLVCAADDISVTLGAKVWNNKWTSWDYYQPFALSKLQSLPGASENFTSNSNKMAFIPSVTVRYKNFLVTGSMFTGTDYGFTGADNDGFSAKRDETDLHVGYYVLPTLALTVGYKDVKQDFGSGHQFKYSGPIVGMSGSAPLTQGFSLYGNFGYGMGMKAEFPTGFSDGNGNTSRSADYYLSEVGIAYSIDPRAFMPAAKGLSVTAGYRNQTLATQNFNVGMDANNPAKTRSTELRDNTEGLAFGVSLTF